MNRLQEESHRACSDGRSAKEENKQSAVNPKVIKVRPERDYMLSLWFENGERRRFDMKPYLDYEVLRALREWSVFSTAATFLGSVTWANDSDLSYDTLYLEGVPATS
jgi:hypothetical protein